MRSVWEGWLTFASILAVSALLFGAPEAGEGKRAPDTRTPTEASKEASKDAGEKAAERKDRDAIMEEYRTRKEKTSAKDAEAQFQLGKWCEENGLKTQAANQYRLAVKLNPKHEEANKKLGNELVQTPKGAMWLSKKEIADYEEEKADFTVPEGNATAFFRQWERRVPLTVKMSDETVDPEKARRRGWLNMRVRKILTTELTLTNRYSGTVEAKGTKLSSGKKWTEKTEDWLLETGYRDDWGARRTRSSFQMEAPFTVEGTYGHRLNLKYVLQVPPEEADTVLRSAEAEKIRRALQVTIEEDQRAGRRRSRDAQQPGSARGDMQPM